MWRKQIFVYIDEDFAINRIQHNFVSPSMTGKFRRGVTERVCLKIIFKSGELYHYSTDVFSTILSLACSEFAVHMQNLL